MSFALIILIVLMFEVFGFVLAIIPEAAPVISPPAAQDASAYYAAPSITPHNTYYISMSAAFSPVAI